MDPLSRQIQAIQVVSAKPVVAITVNHEDIPRSQVAAVCASIEETTGLPTVDVLLSGADRLVEALLPLIKARQAANAV